MNPHDKFKLRSNRVDLVENIKPIDPILDFLVAKETITPAMTEDIQAEPTNDDKVARLLNMLEKRGPIAFYHFRESLLSQEAYEHLVRKLDNTDISKMPPIRTGADETDATKMETGHPQQQSQSTARGPTSSNIPPQSARIHTNATAQGTTRGAAATGTIHASRNNIVIKGNSNMVIMGGKNSTINFK